jgi:DNA-binding CsgD family transcriptional regulator
MSLLRSRDYERMLDLVAAMLAAPDPQGSWQEVVDELIAGLHGLMALFSDVQNGHGRVRAWAPAWIGELPLDELLDRNLQGGHPLPRHYQLTGDRRPRAVTDIVDRRTWRRSPAYAILHETVGATRHIAIPLSPAGTGGLRALIVHRDGRDFTDRERAYVHRLQPLLTGLDRHIAELRGWRRTVAELPGSATDRAATDQADDCRLTPRELTVLHLLGQGLTAEAAARRLGISGRTVHKHAGSIYKKLRATDRLGAVLRAQSLGLLPSPNSAVRPG